MKETSFENILIYGLGLIGGSIGLRIKEKKLPYRISGITRSKESANKAKRLKVVDFVFDKADKDLSNTDLVIFCVPPLKMVSNLTKILPHLKDNTIITDVSSVKGSEYKKIESTVKRLNKKYSKNIVYIGSHPMAGSERKGVENSDGKFFDKAVVFITPFKGTKKEDINRVKEFWKSLGSIPTVLSIEEHDSCVAYTSHLSHILASALTNTVWNQSKKSKNVKTAVSSSFKDITRITSSDPSLWTEISYVNKKNLKKAVSDLIQILNKTEYILDKQDKLEKFFKDNKKNREKLIKR